MSGLLVIGAITGEMRDRLTGSLEIHDADRIDDMTAFLAQMARLSTTR